MPFFGVARTERPLGLHPRPCRRCAPVADRLVTHRRWGFHAFSLPMVAFDAHWTTCSRCHSRSGSPRLSVPTVVLATLVLFAFMGRGLPGPGTLFAWVGLALLWSVWLVGYTWDRAADRRLVPLPSRLGARPRRTRRPTQPTRSRPARRVNRVLRPLVRGASVLRSFRGLRRNRA